VITGLICFFLSVTFITLGGISLQIVVLGCALLGLTEIYKALSQKFLPIHTLGYLLSIFYILIITNYSFEKFAVIVIAFFILMSVFYVFRCFDTNIIDCCITLFGFFYVTFLLSFILLVRIQTYGNLFVWLIFISAWCCDTCAYFAGSIFGKNKLMPNISPKKTIEGSIGGILGAVLIAYLYSICFMQSINIFNVNVKLLCVAICFIGSIISQLGDLSASAIKRYAHLKDYGNILPGHGGFIDRFDSVLFAAPTIYVLLYFIRLYKG
jgi:phosphatidate cytidylyltransferase